MNYSAYRQSYDYFLKIERAMSPNTAAAYCSDLDDFFGSIGKEPENVARDDATALLILFLLMWQLVRKREC